MRPMPPPSRIDGIKRIIAVASGKGGVGKTTVTVNLALALLNRGARVGLFDADIYGPNVPLMLGVRRRMSSAGYAPLGRADNKPYIEALERYGLRVMSMGLLVGDTQALMPDPMQVGLLVVRTLKDVIWGELDYLLLDLPPGTGEPQQTLLRTVNVDGVVVVTTPQDLSQMDASRSLGLFKQAEVPVLGVIENMSYLICPHCGDRIEVFHRSANRWAVQGDNLDLLGRIPMDINISKGIDAGHPLLESTPGASVASVFEEIADKVAEKLVE